MADILAVLYADVLVHDPEDPALPERDRFILSKGHAGAAVYAVLAERGFFPRSVLESHYADGSNLSGHVSHKGVPGVELSTGSLGHGLSVGAGMAMGLGRRAPAPRVFVVLSEGDCNEGSTWEAAMFAGHHRLANLVAVVDYNRLQSLSDTGSTLELEPFADKWRAFGWDVVEVDGHDHDQLRRSFLSTAGAVRPRCVLARTVKGRGVRFMENQVLWHYRPPTDDELQAALDDLGVLG